MTGQRVHAQVTIIHVRLENFHCESIEFILIDDNRLKKSDLYICVNGNTINIKIYKQIVFVEQLVQSYRTLIKY